MALMWPAVSLMRDEKHMQQKTIFVLLLISAFIAGLRLSGATVKPAIGKKYPNPFGYLDVSDPSLVHVRRGTSSLLTDWDYAPADLLSWQVHLPEGKKWRLCWAFGKFPRDGTPTE